MKLCHACKKNNAKGAGQDQIIYKNTNGVTRVYDVCPDCARQILQILGPGQVYNGIQSTNDSQRNSQETPVIKKGWPR